MWGSSLGNIGKTVSSVGASIAKGTNVFDEIKAKKYVNDLGRIEEELIVTLTQCFDKFEEDMSTRWGSPNAVSFFKSFAESNEKLMKAIRSSFDNIATNFNDVAKRDAEDKGSVWSKVFISHANMKPVVSAKVKEKLQEGVGIKSDEVSDLVENYSKSVRAAVESAAKSLKNIAQDNGLVGVNKKNAFISVSDVVQNNLIKAIDNAMDFAKSKIKKATAEEAIDDAVVSVIRSLNDGISGLFESIF